MPRKGKPGVSAARNRTVALLENIQEQNRATIEAVMAVKAELISRMDSRFEQLERRLDALEIAVRKNSDDIRKNSDDIRKNSDDIRKNSDDIEQLRREVRRLCVVLRADEGENAIEELRRRVRALEERAGIASPA